MGIDIEPMAFRLAHQRYKPLSYWDPHNSTITFILEIERRLLKVTPKKVVAVTNRNVGRFVDGAKILASIDLLWCSESFFSKHPVHKEYGP